MHVCVSVWVCLGVCESVGVGVDVCGCGCVCVVCLGGFVCVGGVLVCVCGVWVCVCVCLGGCVSVCLCVSVFLGGCVCECVWVVVCVCVCFANDNRQNRALQVCRDHRGTNNRRTKSFV